VGISVVVIVFVLEETSQSTNVLEWISKVFVEGSRSA
jgi:hypothetical protein